MATTLDECQPTVETIVLTPDDTTMVQRMRHTVTVTVNVTVVTRTKTTAAGVAVRAVEDAPVTFVASRMAITTTVLSRAMTGEQ